MTILDQLAGHARERTLLAKKELPLTVLKEKVHSLPKGNFPFEQALRKPGISFICECKKASPSKGVISLDFPYLQIAREYEEAGADCISILTEPKWFLGQNSYLAEIASAASLPCLRKDFVVDEYMIYEAKTLGAAAVLLICSILSQSQLQEYLRLCDELGLSALTETHCQDEVLTAIDAGARIIGINNRNLNDFSVDLNNSRSLRTLLPSDRIFVAESGISSTEDILALSEIGADAVLVGEALIRSPDKKALMQTWRNCL